MWEKRIMIFECSKKLIWIQHTLYWDNRFNITYLRVYFEVFKLNSESCENKIQLV